MNSAAGYDWDEWLTIAVGPLNMTPQEFWKSTPSEIRYMIAGYNERQQQKYEEIAFGAWLTEVLHRQKRLPRFERLINRNKAKVQKVRSIEEKRQEWLELKQEFGK